MSTIGTVPTKLHPSPPFQIINWRYGNYDILTRHHKREVILRGPSQEGREKGCKKVGWANVLYCAFVHSYTKQYTSTYTMVLIRMGGRGYRSEGGGGVKIVDGGLQALEGGSYCILNWTGPVSSPLF
jgi:hypothetical protein